MTGGSTAGYSRTPRYVKLITPKSTITTDMTMARTGRRMLSEERLMGVGSWLWLLAVGGLIWIVFSQPTANSQQPRPYSAT